MGVKGLQTFVESYDTVFRLFDIPQMVEDYRKKHPNATKDPVIVVDGVNCLMHLWVEKVEWIHGGQWDEFRKILSDFLTAFRRIGVKLVFFFDGLVPAGKREEWLSRRHQRIDKIKMVFGRIKASLPYEPDTFILPAGLINVMSLTLKYIFHATVFYNVDEECDSTIASFAAHHKCMAILAQDSDFIIYPTVSYISIKHLDLKTMQTRVYCREALCQELRINQWMLPLFACMIGNDFISREMLSSFHSNISANRFIPGLPRIHTIVKCVAVFIAKMQVGSQAELMRRLPEIYTSIGLQHAVSLEDFQRGMDMYSLSLSENDGYLFHGTQQKDVEKNEPIYDFLLRKVQNKELISMILNVICSGRSSYIPALEDVNAERKLALGVLVYRPLRQRMYGLIFQLKENYFDKSMLVQHTGAKIPKPNTVEEWWVNPLEPTSIVQDIISPLSLVLPDGVSNASVLHDIIMENDKDLDAKKLAVFMACAGLKITDASFQSLLHTHISMCAILHYLIEMPEVAIEMWEVEAFIIQSIHPRLNDFEWQKALQLEPYNSRAVHLASLFLQGADTFLDLLWFCGNPINIEHFMPWNFFNGKMFHYIYKCMHEGVKVGLSGEHRTKFQHLKSVILEGVDIQTRFS